MASDEKVYVKAVIPSTDAAGNQFSPEATRQMAAQAKDLPIYFETEMIPRGRILEAKQTEHGLEIHGVILTGFDLAPAGFKRLLDAGVSIRGHKGQAGSE